jgi:hypothetical protein
MTQPPTTPPPGGLQYQVPPQGSPGKGLAITSLVLGIVACALFCVPWLPRILGILAIVLGVVAITQGAGGMAKAGLVLGIVGIAISVVFWIAAGMAAKKGANFFQQKMDEVQKKAEQMQKDAEEAQKKAQEQMQKQNTTSQPGVILVHPSGWTVVLD